MGWASCPPLTLGGQDAHPTRVVKYFFIWKSLNSKILNHHVLKIMFMSQCPRVFAFIFIGTPTGGDKRSLTPKGVSLVMHERNTYFLLPHSLLPTPHSPCFLGVLSHCPNCSSTNSHKICSTRCCTS